MVVLAGKLLAGLWEACFSVTVPVRERLANTNSERSILMAVVHVLKSPVFTVTTAFQWFYDNSNVRNWIQTVSKSDHQSQLRQYREEPLLQEYRR